MKTSAPHMPTDTGEPNQTKIDIAVQYIAKMYTIESNQGKKPREIYQLAVALHYLHENGLNYPAIRERTGLDHFHGTAMGRYRKTLLLLPEDQQKVMDGKMNITSIEKLFRFKRRTIQESDYKPYMSFDQCLPYILSAIGSDKLLTKISGKVRPRSPEIPCEPPAKRPAVAVVPYAHDSFIPRIPEATFVRLTDPCSPPYYSPVQKRTSASTPQFSYEYLPQLTQQPTLKAPEIMEVAVPSPLFYLAKAVTGIVELPPPAAAHSPLMCISSSSPFGHNVFRPIVTAESQLTPSRIIRPIAMPVAQRSLSQLSLDSRGSPMTTDESRAAVSDGSNDTRTSPFSVISVRDNSPVLRPFSKTLGESGGRDSGR